MFKCKWRNVGLNAWQTSCSENIYAGAMYSNFLIKYCPCCGKKIKVVEQ